MDDNSQVQISAQTPTETNFAVNVDAVSNVVTQDFKSMFSDEFRPVIEKYKTPDELANGLKHLQSKIGEAPISRPKQNATPEEHQAFKDSLYKELGRPDDFSGYDIKLQEGFEKAIDTDVLEALKPIFHKNGLSAEGANELVNSYVSMQQEKVTKQVQQNKAALEQEWGVSTQAKQNQIKDFVSQFGGKELADSLHFGEDRRVIKMLENVVEAFNGQPALAGNISQSSMQSNDLKSKLTELQKNSAYNNIADPLHQSIREQANEISLALTKHKLGIKD